MRLNKEEIRNVVANMKGGKETKLDGIAAEFFKKGGEPLVEWVRRILKTY